VAADALKRQIEAIGDPGMGSACTIDGRLSADPVARKHERTSGRVAEVLGQVIFRDLAYDAPRLFPQPGGDRVAGEEEDTGRGSVHEVRAGFHSQVEVLAGGQLLAPQQLVVLPQGGAEGVGVLAGRST
jgi:hypothetical protein